MDPSDRQATPPGDPGDALGEALERLAAGLDPAAALEPLLARIAVEAGADEAVLDEPGGESARWPAALRAQGDGGTAARAAIALDPGRRGPGPEGSARATLTLARAGGPFAPALASSLGPWLRACAGVLTARRVHRARLAADEALARSEARARAVLEAAVDAIVTADARGTILSVNPATERMFGHAASALVGQDVSILMAPADRDRHGGYVDRYRATGVPHVIGIGREVEGRRRDGSLFPAELALGEARLGDERVFTAILRDVTERHRAAEALGRAMGELARSRDGLQALLDEMRVGAASLGPDGALRFVSASCERALGVERQAVVGRAWREVLPFSSEAAGRVAAALASAPEARRRLLLEVLPGPGRARWVEADVHDDPREPGGRLLLFYDVSELRELRDRLDQGRSGRIIGGSPPMRRLYEQIAAVARGDWTVLIEGETGVGKELVAHALHDESARRDGPFVAINCAGLSESLLQSQLFGHRRGAFTGAVHDQVGLFEAATGGTLFLDELGDVPMNVQLALLRVLQEKEVTRLGEAHPRRVDARVVAATQRDLPAEVAAGRFRADLLYRVRVARIRVPPLRERREDIPLLVRAFLDGGAAELGGAAVDVEPDALGRLLEHPWPGNVRELKATIDFAAIERRGAAIRLEDLPPELQAARPDGKAAPTAPSPGPELERRILDALARAGGRRTDAARLLGVSRATLYRWLDEQSIALPPASRRPR